MSVVGAGDATPVGDRGATTSEIVVDQLRWWDLDCVLVLEGELFAGGAWTAGQFWSELARVPDSRWYVAARRGDRVVGYAGVFLIGPEADIQTVAVAADEQGRGIGRRLVVALVDRARQAGARVLRLEVRADNAPALALYRALRFTVDGRRRDYYARGQDALLMSRDLGSVHD